MSDVSSDPVRAALRVAECRGLVRVRDAEQLKSRCVCWDNRNRAQRGRAITYNNHVIRVVMRRILRSAPSNEDLVPTAFWQSRTHAVSWRRLWICVLEHVHGSPRQARFHSDACERQESSGLVIAYQHVPQSYLGRSNVRIIEVAPIYPVTSTCITLANGHASMVGRLERPNRGERWATTASETFNYRVFDWHLGLLGNR